MLVEQASADVAKISVGIGYCYPVEFYLVGDECDSLVLKEISCVEWSDMSLAVHGHLTYEVDIVEWSHEV